MTVAKLTSKGQLTIPKIVREKLKLHTGDRVVFIVQGDSEALLKPQTKSVDEVYGMLKSPDQATRSVAEMKAAVARRIREQGQ